MPDRHLAHRFWGDRDPQSNYQGIRAEHDAETAEIKLYDPIDSWGEPFGVSAKDFTDALDALPEGTKSITLRINSPGGEVGDGLAIMNALRSHKATVNVVVEGRAASAASFIAMAGNTVTMAPQSQMMIHDAAGIGIGNAKDMADYAAFLDKSSDNVAAAYAARAGGTVAQWREVMRAETWFNDQEAVDAKLADKVGTATAPTARAAMNRFDLSIFNYAGREQAPEPKTPAEPPVIPPTDPKEADAMSDTLLKGLRERFEIPEGADDTAVLAAIDADSAARDKTIEDLEAKATAKPKVDVPEGMQLVSEARLDALTAQADLGAKAHARQISDDRAALISVAMDVGKISRDDKTKAVWEREFARDFDTAKADLDSLPARFPIGDAPGRLGSEHDNVHTYTDEMAAEDAAFLGVDAEVLSR